MARSIIDASGDADLGKRLFGLTCGAGFSDVHVRVVQPVHTGLAPEKALALVTLQNIVSAVLSESLATETELHTDIANLEALAGNPVDVVNALDALLLHGTMHPQMRASIITAMNAINDANVATRNQKRARAAVYLVATSSQYDIQR